MPDLSKRPERYATVLVVALIAGSFAYSALGVRFGSDPRVAELRAQNEQLQQKMKTSAVAPTPTKAQTKAEARAEAAAARKEKERVAREAVGHDEEEDCEADQRQLTSECLAGVAKKAHIRVSLARRKRACATAAAAMNNSGDEIISKPPE